MKYSKSDFARDLKTQLERGYEPRRIGSWAHKMYLEYCGKIDKDLEEIMIDLFVLEEGVEFELPESAIKELIRKLDN